MSALLDISIALAEGAPVWPGDTPFTCGWTARRESGSSINLASLHGSAHAGTHADAPLHVESGWGGSETLPIDAFVGDALLISLSQAHDGNEAIDVPLLEALLAPHVAEADACARLLIRTGRSVAHGAFPEGWPALSEHAAHWLVARGVRLVGVDAPSVDARTSTSLPVHHALFSAGAFVLENLSLDGVVPGHYELIAQPLLVVGADAAPARALLRTRRNESPRSGSPRQD